MSVFVYFSRDMRKSEAMTGRRTMRKHTNHRNEFQHLTLPVGRCFLVETTQKREWNSMLDGIEIVNPRDIEEKSFEIITALLGDRVFPPGHESIIKRVIHTTADLEYADNLYISEKALEKAFDAIKGGGHLVTDTQMAAAGIRKGSLARYGGRVINFIGEEDVAREAEARNVTRSSVCMERGAADENNRIFVVGNAPTALIRLVELMKEGTVSPALVVGVPVGFVNVVESKNLLKKSGVPCIITEGRKGGSTVAAAIVNALLIMMEKNETPVAKK